MNWTGRTGRDPWYTGGDVPEVPKRCKRKVEVGTQDGKGLPLGNPLTCS